MFKVMITNEKYKWETRTVYAINQDKFLIWNDGYWEWINMEDCVPINE